MGNFDVVRRNCVIQCVLRRSYLGIWEVLKVRCTHVRTWVDDRLHSSIQKVELWSVVVDKQEHFVLNVLKVLHVVTVSTESKPSKISSSEKP
jgi:hypothetical protein